MVVKLVGAGVGLGVEAYHHHKEKKRSLSSSPAGEGGDALASSSRSASDNDINRGIHNLDINPGSDSRDDIRRSKSAQEGGVPDEAPPAYVELPQEEAETLIERGQAVRVDEKGRELSPEENPPEYDEQDWALDEAADEADGTAADKHQPEEDGKKMSARVNVEELIAKFMVKHPEIGRPVVSTGLPVPVILPQRRPGTKKRGFVRAYAPALDNCGISQELFLDFLETFDECAKVSHDTQQSSERETSTNSLFHTRGIPGSQVSCLQLALLDLCLESLPWPSQPQSKSLPVPPWKYKAVPAPTSTSIR